MVEVTGGQAAAVQEADDLHSHAVTAGLSLRSAARPAGHLSRPSLTARSAPVWLGYSVPSGTENTESEFSTSLVIVQVAAVSLVDTLLFESDSFAVQ